VNGLLLRVAVNSTHGQLDTCVELTHLPKSQLDTSQLDTGVNSTQLDTYGNTQQFNYSALDLCSRVAVNSTHGQLDTCVELTHLPKSQLDTSQLDTGVNSTQLDTYGNTQQFNC